MDKMIMDNQKNFLSDAVAIVEKGRQTAYASVNQAMIATYWQLGKHIVKFEQGGAERAEYGKELIIKLSAELTAKFGKGYTARNLRNFRQFYLVFPQQEIWHTRVPNLTWSLQAVLTYTGRTKKGNRTSKRDFSTGKGR